MSKQAKMGGTSKPLSLNQKSKKITKLSPTDYHQYLMATRKVRGASLDPGDWRNQLHPDSRQRIVNKISDESKRHCHFSSPEEEYQIERTAARFGEEAFAAATSQSDYLQKIALKLVSMEFSYQTVPSNNAGIINRPPNSDSTIQTGHANGGDWQEEVYQKIKALKEMYALELNEMLVKITAKLLEHDLLLQRLEHIEKLRIFKYMLNRIIAFLHLPKDKITLGYKERIGSYERQIINFINTKKPRKPVSSICHPTIRVQDSLPRQ